ncbi:MAG: hypothetical protein ACRDOO_19715 [Actinomadura sp.]
MIILSGALVVLAIALLIAGILFGNSGAELLGLDGLMMIYVSITVSIVSALCLAIGVYLRRRELFGKVDTGQAGTPKADKKTKKARKGGPKGAADTDPAATEPAAEDAFTLPVPAVDVPADALVHVVRGRKRYHLDSCRQLAGRGKEELTYAEAQEEGFSPCTACMPDTALAARAAGSDAGSQPAAASGAVGRGTATAASSTAGSRSDWAARRAGGMGRELFVPRPNHAEPTGTAADEGDEDLTPAEPAPAAEWSTTTPAAGTTDPPADPPAEERSSSTAEDRADEPGSSTDATATAQFSSVPPATAAAEPAVTEPAERPDREAPDHSTATADTAATDSSAEGAAAEGEGPQVRILSGTKRYHRAECALIEDIGDDADDLEALSRAEAKARGCTPCLVCQPDLEHSRD